MWAEGRKKCHLHHTVAPLPSQGPSIPVSTSSLLWSPHLYEGLLLKATNLNFLTPQKAI